MEQSGSINSDNVKSFPPSNFCLKVTVELGPAITGRQDVFTRNEIVTLLNREINHAPESPYAVILKSFLKGIEADRSGKENIAIHTTDYYMPCGTCDYMGGQGRQVLTSIQTQYCTSC